MCKKLFTQLGFLLVLFSLLITSCATPQTAAPVEPTKEPVAVQPSTATEKPKEAAPTQPPASSEPVTVTVLHNWGPSDSKGPVLKKIFDDCMVANPGLKIVTDIQVDADIPNKAETSFLAEQEPELILSNMFPQTYKWIDTGLTVPINDYIKEWGLDGKFRENALSTWTDTKGRIMGFPLEGYNWPMWYNTKIFKELNLPIPTTWDEVLADAPKIKAAGYDVVSVGGNGDSGWYMFMTFLFNSLTKEEMAKYYQEGHLANYPNAVKAIEQFVKLRDAGIFPKDAPGLQEEAVNNMFYSGKAAMWSGGSWFYGEAPEAFRPDVMVGGIPLTTPTVWDKNWVLTGDDAKAVWITRNGVKKIDAVKKIVQCIYSPENIGNFVVEAGMPPPLKEVKIDETKLNPIFMQTLKWGDKYSYTSLPLGAAGVDTSQAFKDLWLPTTTADMIVKEIDQAYMEGLGK